MVAAVVALADNWPTRHEPMPKLILVCGTSFAGKSTVARHLAASQSVIDASRYFRKSERDAARALCRTHGGALVTVHVDTPEHITRQRLLANRRSRARRDVSDEAFAAILAAWEPPTADEHALVFPFGDDVDAWMERHAAAIADA